MFKLIFPDFKDDALNTFTGDIVTIKSTCVILFCFDSGNQSKILDAIYFNYNIIRKIYKLCTVEQKTGGELEMCHLEILKYKTI